MKRLGQLHPITTKIWKHPDHPDKRYKLVAGEMRFTAATNENKWDEILADVRENLSELDEIDIELEENLRRKSLFGYEIDIGLAKREKIYQTLHPETIKGAVGSGRSKQDVIKNRLSVTDNLKKEVKPPAPRFSKATAESFSMSESTIKSHLRVGQAILEDRVDEKTKKQYMEREISHSKVYNLVKKQEALESARKKKEWLEKREIGKYLALAAMENPDPSEITSDVLAQEYDDDQKEEMMEAINMVREEEKVELLKFCADCKKKEFQYCPTCRKKFIVCKKYKNLVFLDIDHEPCEEFEPS